MAAAPALLLAACSQSVSTPDTSAGAKLETAARQAGLISVSSGPLTGAWGRDTDRVCIVSTEHERITIGARVDYGEGQGCAASGTAVRTRDGLRVSFGACTFDAVVDGDRMSFPAELPPACDRLCTGRASLAALGVDRLSASPSEAATLAAPGGRQLCHG